MERGFGETGRADRDNPEAARLAADAQAQAYEGTATRGQALRAEASGRSQQEILHEALEAARLEHRVQAERLEAARAQLQAITKWIETGRPQREVLHESAVARMQARLESLPVIEQAKGILMAQQQCGPEEAFDLLRRASQRANLKLHVLAAQIVEQVASPPAKASAQPTQRTACGHRDQSRSPRAQP